jgi:NTE family protein
MFDGVCLSGGADNGAYQAGAYLYLAECGLLSAVKIWSGTSVGAINLGGYAMFGRGEQLAAAEYVRELWLERITDWRSIYRHRFPPWVSSAWSNSIYQTHPLRRLLEELVDVDRIRASGNLCRITATNLESLKLEVFDQNHEHLLDCIMASSAFPVAMPLTQIGGRGPFYTDGYLDTAPLAHTIEAGARRVVCILTQDPWAPKPVKADELGTVPKVFMRVMAGFVQEIMRNDVETCEHVNELVELGLARPGQDRVDVTVIAPSRPLGPSLDFDAQGIRDNMELGYNDARSTLAAK